VDSKTGAWFYCYTVNEAEVMYNEALNETRGAQAAVAWTVRDRALEVLRGVWNADGTWAGGSCDSYPGGGYSQGTCSSLPCEDVNYQNCPVTRWYCCAIHGGTIAVGTLQYQFNDTHVDWATLCATGLPYLAYYAQNGLIPDPSANWAPPNVYNCFFGCTSPYPWCNTGSNFIDGSPNGAMEYRTGSYTAGVTVPPLSDCKQLAVDLLGNIGFVCPNGGGDNYFWNRKDHVPVGSVSVLNQQTLSGCSADPDTPWLTTFIDIYVDGPPGVGYYIGSTGASQYVPGGCNVGGQNYGTARGFTFTIPSSYRTGHHYFYVNGRNTSKGAAPGGLPPYPVRSPW
jgi:hypothetical protein